MTTKDKQISPFERESSDSSCGSDNQQPSISLPRFPNLLRQRSRLTCRLLHRPGEVPTPQRCKLTDNMYAFYVYSSLARVGSRISLSVYVHLSFILTWQDELPSSQQDVSWFYLMDKVPLTLPISLLNGAPFRMPEHSPAAISRTDRIRSESCSLTPPQVQPSCFYLY